MLNALFCPNTRETFRASFSRSRWGGLLKDCPYSCSVVIATEKCLEFAWSGASVHRWHSLCGKKPRCGLNGIQVKRCSSLETNLVINEEARRPRGLDLDRERMRWRLNDLHPGDIFDLGESGRLLLLEPCGRMAVMKWVSSPMSQTASSLIRRVTNQEQARCHQEMVRLTIHDDGQLEVDRQPEPIRIYIVSS